MCDAIPRIIKSSYIAIETRPGRARGRDELILAYMISEVHDYSAKILTLGQNFSPYSDVLTSIIKDLRRSIWGYCSLGSCFNQ
jgi:hypothetical protein